MKKLALNVLTLTVLATASLSASAAEVCKVSMMGRVCFDDTASDNAYFLSHEGRCGGRSC